MALTSDQLGALRFDDDGLIPAIVQQTGTGEVLTLAYMSRESLERTLDLGETVFWSRSRGELWHKGETSGHVQPVRGIRSDCDGDALLVEVDIGPEGVACHTGARSCFHHELDPGRHGVDRPAPPGPE